MKRILFSILFFCTTAQAQYTSNDIVLVITYGQSNAVGVAPQWYGGIDLAQTKYNVTKLERDNVTGVLSFYKSQEYQQSINEPTYARDRVAIAPMLGDLMAQYLIGAGVSTEVLTISAGRNGIGITGIYKNQASYNYLLVAIDSAKAYALRKGKTLRCAYIAFLHGETDASNNLVSYDAYLKGLTDYFNTDIKAITGQTEDIPMVCTQLGFSYWSDLSGSYPTRTMNICNYQIAALSNARVRLATPGYIAPLEGQEFYSAAKNFQASHYSGPGLKQLAGYIQKCWQAASWASFKCATATLSTNEITVTLTPITGSISLDATRICKNGTYGFEFTDAGNANITITGVTVLNSTQLKITLSTTPTASAKTLYYAYSMNYQVDGLQYYRQNGAVKDADNNYLLAFSKVIP
jgi:hypothetical protein